MLISMRMHTYSGAGASGGSRTLSMMCTTYVRACVRACARADMLAHVLARTHACTPFDAMTSAVTMFAALLAPWTWPDSSLPTVG